MKRKEFISRAWKSLLGAAALLILSGSSNTASDTSENEQEEQMTRKQKFIHDWIKNLMDNMDQHLADKKKINLLEECGRACARGHAKQEAMKYEGQLDGWLATMEKWIGKGNIRKERKVVKVIYDKCFCPLVQTGPPLNSGTYCNCSRGWLKEVFETVIGKKVEVELNESIMGGGKKCRFSVFL